MIDFRELIKAGVHFGHQTSRWVPKMKPYIWGVKNKVHLIDISKTAYQLEKAAQFLEGVAVEGKQILWVGTKRAAQEVIHTTATKLDMPYVNHRWIGGTLSNPEQVKKSVTKMLHYEDVLAKSEKFPHYTKKELNEFQKAVARLQTSIGGIRNLKWPLGAVVLVDVIKERSALREAVKMGIPVVAIVDTNGDPSFVDYVIPANDDAPRSIKVIIDYLLESVSKGQEAAAQVEKEKQAQKKKEGAAKESSKVADVQAKGAKTAKPEAAKPSAAPVKVAQSKAEADKSEGEPKKEQVKAEKTVAKTTAPKAKAPTKPAAKKPEKKSAGTTTARKTNNS